jgi:3-oxoacyl-(acyl-carrier-protein) synthase
MVVGGVDAFVTEYAIAGFDSLTSLARDYNDHPEAASRPFDADRCGFVYSEGCGVLILETLEVALKRDVRIYAEVKGHAATNDAFHMTALHPNGDGALRAMQWAVEDANLNGRSIDYINAHGTSTKSNDKVETFAIKRLFGEQAYNIPITSTKSMTGHALGGAGAIEAVACIMTLQDQVIHPTINYTTPDPDCDLDYVPNEARDAVVGYVLSNSFGLGGQNACIVLGKV